jgi:hypothetical protein
LVSKQNQLDLCLDAFPAFHEKLDILHDQLAAIVEKY